jgi:hypothetical protein
MPVCVCIGICSCAAAAVVVLAATYYNYTKMPYSDCVDTGGITTISEKEIEF